MCHYRITTYENCKAIRKHLVVCANQVEHTHLQVDNHPCANITSAQRELGFTTYCNCKVDETQCNRMARPAFGERRGNTGYTWAFEKVPARATEWGGSRARTEGEGTSRAASEMGSSHGGGVGGLLGPGRRGAIDLGGSRGARARDDDQPMGSGVLTDNAGNGAKKRKTMGDTSGTVVDKENEVGQDVDMGL
ncbi:uncharacterized protein L3040_001370 [Drepanopeziza brunnea f. sp. 'multigermtubi']|uniref:uncharacterized protein n=1 Tax=Drepanopeziza brunnea f. sp. 'multigermtubi' TaxID=698441 RepID=UPI002382E112|nr:hypothetical protein L3040_001370 [Drepanopeziza brunnea f. sp. 'multigermtubi']